MAIIFECIQTAGIAQLPYLVDYDSAGVAAVLDPRADVDCYLDLAREKKVSVTHFNANPPRVNWGFGSVVATIAGGTIAALTGGEFTNEWLPPMWEARFGDSIALRAAIGFGGTLLMAFSARLAGGCTSGHGISGTMQMDVASWISVMCFFIGGIAVAIPLFTL